MTTDAELLTLARTAATHAYAPYSKFSVGSAIRMTDGTIYSGCNVENASYGLTICAERNGITTMIAATDSPEQRAIDTVAIVSLNATNCWPCGACLQVLREFHCRRVIVEDPAGQPTTVLFDDLLPYSFGPEHIA